MANVRYVDADSTAGGDGTTNALAGANRAYVSLSAWEAARQAILADVEECICESSNVAHTADTTPVTITGWTTDATNYIHIHTSAGARHAGVWNAAKYRLITANSRALRIEENYVRLDGLQISKSAVNANDQHAISIGGVVAGGSAIWISNCITTHAADAFRQSGIQVADADATVYIWNHIDYGHPNVASVYNSSLAVDVAAPVSIYSSTLIGGTRGIANAGGTIVAKNCYGHFTVVGGSAYNTSAGTTTQTNCAASDTTADGTNPVDSVAYSTANFTNVTGGSEDLSLPVGSALLDVGVDTSGEGAPLNFTTDIFTTARPQNSVWDIGAWELIVAGGPAFIAQQRTVIGQAVTRASVH